jgi:hypothetical protein
LLLGALGPAQRRGSRARRATAFEVLATDENQQQNNEQGMDFHLFTSVLKRKESGESLFKSASIRKP